MRKLLAKYKDKELFFSARLGRTGFLTFKKTSVVFIDVKIIGHEQIAANHIWVQQSRRIERYFMKENIGYWDEFIFKATVSVYWKGDFIEYCLKNITNIQKVMRKKSIQSSPLIKILPIK